ncbi:hypothetical protein LOTGIDRAFT_157986 [Lottia gigantea]|uniref:Uncharacterized protein n=1 Tax=Lottia gigantea TaxID=225164 RepID=V4AZW3_LOTGI|nr:hypothetical protein LOTGIDRAFT_157986 [Lottia gigantea]ESP00696.1 hypothetical protein LOTGIDRAFT_157986 [Lottia gigantea]
MEFELSEKFERIDFEIEQALQDVGYHRRRSTEGHIQPYCNKDYSRKNSLQPDCSDIRADDNSINGNITDMENRLNHGTSMKRYCNTSAHGSPTNGDTPTAKDFKPAFCRKMITDCTNVLITNAATNKCALISGGQKHSTLHSTSVTLQGRHKRPRSPMMTETSKLPKARPLSPRNNHSSEHHGTRLSPAQERLAKPDSPRPSQDLFVKLSRPKSPAPRLRIQTSEVSPKGQDLHQKILSPRLSKPESYFVTSSKARPRSSSQISISHRRTVNESASLQESSAAVLQRPRSSPLSPRLTQRAYTTHKYEPKKPQRGTNVLESSPRRLYGSTVNRIYRATSPIRYSIQHHKNVSFGTTSDSSPRKGLSCNINQHPRSAPSSPLYNHRQSFVPHISLSANDASEDDTEDLEDQDSARPIPTIVVTDWDTCTSRPITNFDTGSNSIVEHVFKDSGYDVRRRHSDPSTVDGFKESDAHYKAMLLERRRFSFGDKLQLSDRVGLDIDNLI